MSRAARQRTLPSLTRGLPRAALGLAILCASGWAGAYDCPTASFQRAQGHVLGLAYRLAEAGPECAKAAAAAQAEDADPMLALDYLACYSKAPARRIAPDIDGPAWGVPADVAASEAFGSGFSAGYASPMLSAPQAAQSAADLIFRSERILLATPGKAAELARLREAAASLAAGLAPDREGPAFMRQEADASRSSACVADFATLRAPWTEQRRSALVEIHKALNPHPWADALDSGETKKAVAMSSMAVDWADKGGDASTLKAYAAQAPEPAPKPSLWDSLAAKAGFKGPAKPADAPAPAPKTAAP